MNRELALVVAVIILITLFFLMLDNYPTRADCEEVATVYADRGLFDSRTATGYTAQCRQAMNRESRQAVVDRMNDEAGIAASRR